MGARHLYKEEFGEGDPILCLHGLGANSYTWRHFIGQFASTNKLILVDLKGFGSSAKPADRAYSIHDHAEAIYELIVANDWRNLTLIGNSYGGALALLLAIRFGETQPERLSRLVLIDAGAYRQYLPTYVRLMRTAVGQPLMSLLPARSAAKFVLGFCLHDKTKITEEQLNAYAGPLSDPGGRAALLETGRQCIPDNADELVARYGEIAVPTLILWGRHDRVIPLKVGELLHQSIPNSELEVFEECGHIPQEELPEKTIQRIREFLDAHQITNS